MSALKAQVEIEPNLAVAGLRIGIVMARFNHQIGEGLARGITDVQLTTGVPIANGVLTTENDDQALVRMVQKGGEAAQAAVEMANLLKALK